MTRAAAGGLVPSHRAGRSAARVLTLLVVLAVGSTASGCGAAEHEGSAHPTSSPAGAPTSGASTTEARQATGAVGEGSGSTVPGPVGAAVATAPRALRPVRIAIPALGLDASMTDLGIATDGSIEVPADPSRVGWLDTTPAPGQQGPAVVAGHVDSDTGPAVFYRLSSLAEGDDVVVTLRNGSTASFTVDGVRTYPQKRFPTQEVYGPVPGPALRLITCGGDYVRSDGGYQANVVVYAS